MATSISDTTGIEGERGAVRGAREMPLAPRAPLPAHGAPPPSLRAELLANLAVLAVATLVLAVAGVLLLFRGGEPTHAALWLTVLLGADVAVFVLFGAHLLRRLVLRPLAGALEAAEAIAAGDLQRRVPPGGTRELDGLARSVNRMTDRLLEERRHLVRAEKLASIGRLGAGIAHEIGNPLGAIQGYLHLARGSARDNAAALDSLAGIEREAGRIDRIVRGLLDYARGRRAMATPVDVDGAARAAVELLAAQGATKGIEVALDLGAADATIVGDRFDLEQLFVNLLLNATDAMGEGGRIVIHTRRLASEELTRHGRRRAFDHAVMTTRDANPRVRLWLDDADRPDAAIEIVVADSGPGIPEEDAERVFDPFFTTKEPGKGTGLGLAIVQRIVENSRGTVWVDRAREGGAAFHILFPVVSSAPSRGILS